MLNSCFSWKCSQATGWAVTNCFRIRSGRKSKSGQVTLGLGYTTKSNLYSSCLTVYTTLLWNKLFCLKLWKVSILYWWPCMGPIQKQRLGFEENPVLGQILESERILIHILYRLLCTYGSILAHARKGTGSADCLCVTLGTLSFLPCYSTYLGKDFGKLQKTMLPHFTVLLLVLY